MKELQKVFLESIVQKHFYSTSPGTVEPSSATTTVTKAIMGRLGLVDPSSFSEPDAIITKHCDLNWKVDFDKTKIIGNVFYNFDVLKENQKRILLDIRDIKIKEIVHVICGVETPLEYNISNNVEDIGAKLTIRLPKEPELGCYNLRIAYETSSRASGLQWLTKQQTLGKEHPFLFSQCQAIHARSVIPCQDTPAVKFTYTAHVLHPKELKALMSAILISAETGYTLFKQEIPIPSYLLAIAIGNITSRPLGATSAIWAEPQIVDMCYQEFIHTAEMLQTASDICGEYVWKRYDLLVMPPSFPFGGMENPCLTFVTPTLLAGDRSLVDVVAHEIAHSWTGNLVTNKNFEHFWLNEGFTVFVETKIVGRMRGNLEEDFHMIRNITELRECLRTQLKKNPEMTKLVVDLTECGPDDAFSSVPYIKGSTFLRYLEYIVGGPKQFEPFLRSYLTKFAYQSIDTSIFKQYFIDYFERAGCGHAIEVIDWDLWLYGEGMPPVIPKLNDTLSKACDKMIKNWSTTPTAKLVDDNEINVELTPHQVIDFLGKLNEVRDIVDLTPEKIALLEKTYNLKSTRNSEIRFRLYRLIIRAKDVNRIEEIIDFVNSNFRMKFCRPLYRDLAAWPDARQIAIDNFKEVQNLMMSVCSHTIAKDLGLK